MKARRDIFIAIEIGGKICYTTQWIFIFAHNLCEIQRFYRKKQTVDSISMIEDVSMNLMICDDQKSELENMRQIVSEYALTHTELSLAVKCFVNPFDMLDEIDKSGAPDIALLDICMPGILGTEVAREILGKSTDDTDIIFRTTSPDFAVEAFALHAGDYLTKPYAKQRLTDPLDRVIEKRRNRLYIPVSCGKEIHRIDLYTVLYAEAKNHTVEIHLKFGRCLKTHTTLTAFKPVFETANGFAAVGHRT